MRKQEILHKLAFALTSSMLVSSLILGSVMAAPSGAPNSSNASPNFDGLTITNSGFFQMLDANNQPLAELNNLKFSVKNVAGGLLEFLGNKMVITHNAYEKFAFEILPTSTKLTLAYQFGAGFVKWVNLEVDSTRAVLDGFGISEILVKQDLRVDPANKLVVNQIGSGTDAIYLKSPLSGDVAYFDQIWATSGIGQYYHVGGLPDVSLIPAGGNTILTASCKNSDIVIGCSGNLDLNAPLDIDYRGAWKSNDTTCSAGFSNRTASASNVAKTVTAYCFSPDDSF